MGPGPPSIQTSPLLEFTADGKAIYRTASWASIPCIYNLHESNRNKTVFANVIQNQVFCLAKGILNKYSRVAALMLWDKLRDQKVEIVLYSLQRGDFIAVIVCV